ncbi:MAG: NAD(P)-dependent oxidoreductase, partial [Hyphomicrobiaceae bacterium]
MAITKDTDSVGIVGLGIMGGAFARNLVKAGWTVAGFDVGPSQRQSLAAAGVRIAPDTPAVAAGCSVVITSLPTLKALHSVAEELAGCKDRARIVLETSTVPLADKQRFADAVSAAGHTVIDCPVSGTGAQAETRDLILYPSGDSAAIESLAGLFAGFARGWYDVGAFGNGTRMKFIANHLVAIHNVASAEAMLLAERAGLDLDVVIECIGNGAGASRIDR